MPICFEAISPQSTAIAERSCIAPAMPDIAFEIPGPSAGISTAGRPVSW